MSSTFPLTVIVPYVVFVILLNLQRFFIKQNYQTRDTTVILIGTLNGIYTLIGFVFLVLYGVRSHWYAPIVLFLGGMVLTFISIALEETLTTKKAAIVEAALCPILLTLMFRGLYE